MKKCDFIFADGKTVSYFTLFVIPLDTTEDKKISTTLEINIHKCAFDLSYPYKIYHVHILASVLDTLMNFGLF